jgi:hypothetical protein
MNKILIARNRNPEALDATLRMLPGPRSRIARDANGMPVIEEDCLVIEVEGDTKFLEYALPMQGYADVVRVVDAGGDDGPFVGL